MASYFNDRDKHESPAAPPPKYCPACASATIASAAKVPSADSYWRCMKCGEVWSPARRSAHSTRRW